jgi:hypothetical protein
MAKKALSRESKQLLREIKDLEGMEVHDDYAHLFRELEDHGLISWSSYRGPGMKWRRVTVR